MYMLTAGNVSIPRTDCSVEEIICLICVFIVLTLGIIDCPHRGHDVSESLPGYYVLRSHFSSRFFFVVIFCCFVIARYHTRGF